jgi:type II secretory pathway component PulL
MSRRILGLDIRKTAVSAVLVDSSIHANRIEAYAYIPIPDPIEFDKGVASSLEILVEKMALTGSVCIASFPADQISYRNMQVPFKQPKKIRQILPFEIEPTMPFAVEDLIIDFHVIKADGQEDYTNLIAAAIDMSKLKTYLELLASFQIEPDVVTVSGYPTALCLANLAKTPENAMHIDVDSTHNTLTAFRLGQIGLIRSLPTSRSPSARIETLCSDIQRTLCAFEDTTGIAFMPDRVFISGSSLAENGFEKEMAQGLEIPTQRTNLLRDVNIKLDPHPTQSWNSDLMDGALALALIEIAGIKSVNFRKGPFAVARRWAEHKKNLIKSGILAAAVLLLALFNITIDFYVKQTKLNNLNQQIDATFKSTLPHIKKIVDPVHQMEIEIEKARKSSFLPVKAETGMRMIDILNEISIRIPKGIDVEFTRMVIGEDSILITGNTKTFNSVDEMKSQLERAPIFNAATIVSTNKDKSGNRIRFKLKVQL